MRRVSSRPAFVPATMSDKSPGEASLAVELAGGCVLRMAGPAAISQLADLIVALQSKACAMIAGDLANVQVWVATTPVDMRKSFDGLAEVVRSFLGATHSRAACSCSATRAATCVKILWWDRDGLAIYYKRLERGEFQFPRRQASHRDRRDATPAAAVGTQRESVTCRMNHRILGWRD